VKVLIVDDDKLSLDSIAQFIQEQMSYDIETASSGEEALEKYKTGNPEVVVTDMKMPGKSGITLMKEIKAMNAETEVIIMTGLGDMEL